MPQGNWRGSPRRRPRQRKAVSASSLPDSIMALARFGGTVVRSKFDAAMPSDSHAPAANSAADKIQFWRNSTYPIRRNKSAAKIKYRGSGKTNFFSSIERRIPPAKSATGKREGSFMRAAQAEPAPPYDRFVGKCQIN